MFALAVKWLDFIPLFAPEPDCKSADSTGRRARPPPGRRLPETRAGVTVRVNASWNGQRIPPYGEAWRRDPCGFSFPQVSSGGRYDEGIPDVSFSGTGAPVALIGPSQSLLSPTTDITAQDTLTWVRNRHMLRSGFLVTRNRKDQNGRFNYLGGEIGLPSGQRDEDRWFNTDVFASAPDIRRGNAPIGTIEGPHRYQWDMSLRKNFALRGTARVELSRRRLQPVQPCELQRPEHDRHLS